jgi:hypothetical protein
MCWRYPAGMLAHVRDVLAQVHPDFPWVCLTVLIWLVQYLTRRFAPKVWVVAFSWMPTDLPDMIQRIVQGLPSVLVGALIPAIASGGNPKQALLGALFGAFAPLWHHILKSLPGPYQGVLTPPAAAPAPPADPPA